MKNVTIALPEDVARWARVHAAEHDTSLSAMLRQMLEDRMNEELGYAAAMRSFLTHERRPLKTAGTYPKREELYDRDVVRRHQRSGL